MKHDDLIKRVSARHEEYVERMADLVEELLRASDKPRVKRAVSIVDNIRAALAEHRAVVSGKKLCQDCQGSANHFYMKDGKPFWETCKGCNGQGVK